jgi:hypothetical protein
MVPRPEARWLAARLPVRNLRVAWEAQGGERSITGS